MYRMLISSNFDAAHRLVGYEGKCSRLHGHRWKVEVFITGEKLKNGILIDFDILKEKLGKIIDELDHTYLNDIKEIGNPTAENISKYIFEKINLPENNVKLEKVRVWETENSGCEYYG